jgi:GNAT superfamily N-acetyltransferase
MQLKHESLPYLISDSSDLLEPDAIHAMLQTSYWAAERTRETVERSIEGSLCLGIYDETGQVGFLRAVTDKATISWICDVIVHPGHRGAGLGKWLMEIAVNHPDIARTQMILGTRDAHGLYEQYGFARSEMMRRIRV